MHQLAFPARSTFRPLLAVLAFLTYAVAILWHHDAYKSNWVIEQAGPLPFATSYLFYGKPFGSIDRGLWDSFLKHIVSPEEPLDSFLASVANKKIPSGDTMPTTLDGNALGHAYFATAALFLFGPHSSSLVFGFAILLGVSVLVFLLRFSDDRILAIPILFLALTLMLLTPHATDRPWIDQGPIGGVRFFVIAGILPTLHIIFELLDSTKEQPKQSTYALSGLQFALLLYVTSVRVSAMYLVGAIAFAAMLSIWARRNDASSRRFVVKKIAVLLAVGATAHLAGTLLMPRAYRDTGMGSEVFWTRAFGGFSVHPEWPFWKFGFDVRLHARGPQWPSQRARRKRQLRLCRRDQKRRGTRPVLRAAVRKIGARSVLACRARVSTASHRNLCDLQASNALEHTLGQYPAEHLAAHRANFDSVGCWNHGPCPHARICSGT
jgi:hypothetical protein